MANQADNKQVIQSALLELRELKSKVRQMEQTQHEPIAVIGMGCRFPQADNPTAFWELLRTGTDAVGVPPRDRWEVDVLPNAEDTALDKASRQQGAYLDKVYDFDADFFGIPPREALNMDPQQRLLLEVSWAALEDTGIRPGALTNSETGVYIGYFNRDYADRMLDTGLIHQANPYTLSGNSSSFVAGRLSNFLGLQGPSLVVTTACSSSLVSVHLACQALRTGECDLALAGGVNLILYPTTTMMLAQGGMLAGDGRCKSFDAAADGIGRGEGCGIVVLKRLADAQADGNKILALLRGSAVNHDGAKAVLTAPNGAAQQKLVRKALTVAQITPDEVDYVEAHGTGTLLGDAIEINALAQIFGPQRDRPLLVGAVKSNVGHTEAAAGIASLFKVILALQHEAIPPNLHLNQPNPQVPWARIPIQIPTVVTPWLKGERTRTAGISALGLSGINAHLIVQEPPRRPVNRRPAPAGQKLDRPLHLLPISAKTASALQAQRTRYAAHLAANPDLDWADVCHSAAVGREHFALRHAVVAASLAEAHAALANVPMMTMVDQPKLGFLFAGQEAHLVNGGRELYQTQSTFRAALDRCAEILQPYLAQPLLELLYLNDFGGQQPDPGITSATRGGLLGAQLITHNSQLFLFAIEYALSELWRSWGVKPDMVMGEGVGELVAACVAGVFSLEDGLKLAAARGRLLEETGSTSVDFARAANQVTYGLPQISFVSTRTGATAHKAVATADHWIQQAQQPMRVDGGVDGGFDGAIKTMAQRGVTAFVEMGPASTLLASGQRALAGGDHLWLPTLDPQQEWQQLLTTLGALYGHGVAIDWHGFDAEHIRQTVDLPIYPFQRRHYRLDISTRRVQLERPALQVSLRVALKNASERERRQLLTATIQAEVARALGVEQMPDPHQGFMEIGISSLVAVELRDRLQASIDMPLPTTVLFKYATIADLANYLTGQFGSTDETSLNVGEPIHNPGEREGTHASVSAAAIAQRDIKTQTDIDAIARQFAEQLAVDWESLDGE